MDSEYFLLLASPAAARSQWVAREITAWLEHMAVNKLILILTDGDLVWDNDAKDFDPSKSTALPPTLAGKYAGIQPLYCDFRWAQHQSLQSLKPSKYREAVGTIAATLNGVAKADIIRYDIAAQKKAIRLAWVAAISLAVLAVLAIVAVRRAQQRDSSLKRRVRGQSNNDKWRLQHSLPRNRKP